MTSGITSGTSACMRKALELEITAQPAAANCGSSSRAMSVSSAAKMMPGRAFRSRGRNHHRGNAAGERSVQLPARGFAVGFAAGFVAGGEPRDFKPRVPFEQLDEALTDDSGSAKNADLVSCLHGRIVLKIFWLILDYSAAPESCGEQRASAPVNVSFGDWFRAAGG